MSHKVIRVFLAHPSSFTQEQSLNIATACAAEIKRKALNKYTSAEVLVTTGRKDFDSYFSGNWDDWALSVAKRQNTMTRDELYHLCIVCGPMECTIGKATAMIVQGFILRSGIKSVFVFNHTPDTVLNNSVIQPATSLDCIDTTNYQQGWQVRTASTSNPQE